MILEELEHARRRGAAIYAELVGFGAAADPHGWSEPASDGSAVALAARKALSDASLAADSVDLVATLGAGLPAHDQSEARAIHAVLGSRAGEVPALATKGAIGNNGAGSGAIDVGLAALCIKHQTIPASKTTERVDPACNLNVVRGQPADARIDAALSLAYALGGGQTAALVLRRFDD